MKYPLIILGAGASHDSAQLDNISREKFDKIFPYKPPLANDLFRRSLWDRYVQRWDEISDLATDLVGGIGRYGGLESYLTHLLNDVAPVNEKRAKQIVATRFYIATLFKEISAQYHSPANNFHAMLQAIEDECQNNAIFVNFNYDLLLESNIQNIKNAKYIDDYISGSLKVIKVHGSCNWVHKPVNQINIENDHNASSYVYFVVNAKQVLQNGKIPLCNEVVTSSWDFSNRVNQAQVNYYLPAVSVPLSGKSDYLCPDNHIDQFKEALSKIDRILILGWRSNDPYIVKTLNEFEFNHKLPMYIVSGTQPSAVAISHNFEKNKFNIKACTSEGFNKFMSSSEFVDFWHE